MEASNQRFHHIRNPLRGFRIGEARRSQQEGERGNEDNER